MFIDEKRSWTSRSSELSEMPSISLNSEENKMGVRASYKHFAATRLFSATAREAGGRTVVLGASNPMKYTRRKVAFRLSPACAGSESFPDSLLGLTPQALR